MIIRTLIQHVREMFLGRFFTKFRNSISKTSPEKSKLLQKNQSTNKETIERFHLEASKNLYPSNNINKVLDEIENAIKNEGATNQLLLKKSEILLSKGKLRQARQMLKDVIKDNADLKTSNKSKQLLEISLLLQQEADSKKLEELIVDLQETAHLYGQKPLDLPSTEDLPAGLDITPVIREEACRARSVELPNLSYELINKTLQAGQESPWLLHDKALSLSMMGQKSKALEILRELKKETKGKKLATSINENIEIIKRDSKQYQSKSRFYLTKQVRLIAKSNGIDTEFIPEASKIDDKIRVKFLIFRKARAVLSENPKASFCLVNSILDFFPSDLAALQLKGEALAALSRNDEAIQIWTDLAKSENENIAQKASELITQNCSQKALLINSEKSPKSAILWFINQHLIRNLSPTLNHEIEDILLQLEPIDPEITDPDLKRHQLQIQLNTLVIDCLEAQRREQGHLDPSRAAQKPGAISKTAPKPG